ncbi:MAG: ABC transporter permease subunit, partial [Firmicutes bacterium]|nr:ABC transporter permease subunit [Bacillota bacterium]
MAVIWIVIWMLASHFLGSEFILPSPAATVRALLSLLVTGDFWMDVLWTGFRVILGIVLSFTLGVLAAYLSAKNDTVKAFLKLPVNFFKSIPVMAIIIYVILVVKSDWVAVVVCFLMCFPIAYTNIYNGLKDLDKKQLELGWTLGLSGSRMVRFIIVPALNPEIKTALGLITAMSWKVVVASEVL